LVAIQGLERRLEIALKYGKVFDKEYILILKRYQLHLASATTQRPSGITDAHSKKIEKNYRKKSR
jgi:hypothetical protein